MCATCGCGLKAKTAPGYGKGANAKKTAKKAVKKTAKKPLSTKQKKIAAAAEPTDKITGADFKKLGGRK
jgi:hypothetical protein